MQGGKGGSFFSCRCFIFMAVRNVHALRFELPQVQRKYVIDHDLQFGTSLREMESMELKLCEIVTRTISIK